MPSQTRERVVVRPRIPLLGGLGPLLKLFYLAAFATFSTVSAWITAIKMRHKMRHALGRKVSNREITSISTWMEVKEAEERNRGGKLG